MTLINPKIKGHDPVQKQLQKAFAKQRLPHALLLSGPSGIGKRELAWSLAQMLLCQGSPNEPSKALPSGPAVPVNETSKKSKLPSPPKEESASLSLFDYLDEPEQTPKKPASKESQKSTASKEQHSPLIRGGAVCGLCFSCRQILKKQSENVLEITHESLQIRLPDVQSIPKFLSLQSFAKAKIVLIDEVEKLNLRAANFLLKMIEEPPSQSYFFFISSNPSHLPLTIRSRIQNVRMKALPESLIQEKEPSYPAWMIRGSKGRFDKLKELKEKENLRNKAFELFSFLFENSATIDFSQYVKARAVALDFVSFFQEFFRDLRILKSGLGDHLTHGDKKKELQKRLFYPKEFMDEWAKHSLKMEQELKANYDTVLCFENFYITIKRMIKNYNKRLG